MQIKDLHTAYQANTSDFFLLTVRLHHPVIKQNYGQSEKEYQAILQWQIVYSGGFSVEEKPLLFIA